MSVLVTGASGFIGSHLVRRVAASGSAEVHAVSRFDGPKDEGDARWWRGDLTDLATVRSLITAIKPAVIFHLASHVAGDRRLDHVMPTFRANLMSTVNLLTVAAEVGCRRIVLSGSMEEPAAGDPGIRGPP